MREGPCHRILLHGRWLVVASVACAALVGFLGAPFAARALPPSGWTHDHSAAGIPHRPHGYNALVATFGQPCSAAANAARSSWPSQSTPGVDGYINYHPYIDRDVSWNIRNHISADLKEQALYPGIGGYNCRYVEGTTSWSVHAFGAAIDINWQRNPRGSSTWNGVGADGHNYARYLPKLWKGAYPGHNFYWGLNFSTIPDPMHFQYVTGY
jgi:D-alanyl-D-alanine carboxypeptidase